MSTTGNTEPAQKRSRPWVPLGLLAILALTSAVFMSLRPATLAPVEVTRASLVLVDGKLRERGKSAPFCGVMIERHESGTLKSRSAVSDGLLHGASQGWHTNGQLQVIEHFRAGVSHGSRTKWHANGRKLSEVQIVDGKLHGTFRRWAEDGALLEVIEMKNGEPHGLSRAYYPSGYLKAEVMLSSGQVVQRRHWQDGEYRPGPSVASK